MIAVKPNCVDRDPGPGAGRGGYAIFAGRLSPEKGIRCPAGRLESARRTHSPEDCRRRTAGGARCGPPRPTIPPSRTWDAGLSRNCLSLVGEAACLVVPSIWYEQCPKTLIESFAKGTPVLASRLGAMAELVDHGRTGLLFAPGDPDGLGGHRPAVLGETARRGHAPGGAGGIRSEIHGRVELSPAR